uniref:Transketolase n=1 Tax=candidate division WOR-3 bacterium TaxID=2052148 RepID=A0A7C4TCM2_UNCW3
MKKKNGFYKKLNEEKIEFLQNLARLCRGDILKMTTLAGSGHPGGSMSSTEIYLAVFSFANITPQNYNDPERDRIVVSHGHTSPGLYAVLARLGFFNVKDVLLGFRDLRSPFEGHIERKIPGVEWSTGNLGQGLSAGCGFALAARLKNLDYHTFVIMSDAEQAKGQVGEARRFARKYNLINLTVLIDYNHFQISGRTEEVMPVNIKENYIADGWSVIEVDGHNIKEIFEAINKSILNRENPCAIICNTTIGKGISFMENQAKYHGQALSEGELAWALMELGIENDIEKLKAEKKNFKFKRFRKKEIPLPYLNTGKPKIYTETIDPRVVFGNVLEEIARNNPPDKIAVFDCDLTESVKTYKFAKIRPENFFEAGVSEHSTATIAGALSINGIVTIWGDFGVFGIDEVYNQLRLNDINHTNLKIFATHLGYNVGADGKTHHCIDYLGVLRNLFGFKILLPADPNQTDHIVRYVLNQSGNWVIGVGRTKLPIIKTSEGKIFFDERYTFKYGKADILRDGSDCAIFTMGVMAHRAICAWERLKEEKISACVYNISSPLSIDRQAILNGAKTGLVLTYEDHIVHSGLGSIIAQVIAEENIKTKFVKIGITEYGGSDEPTALYKKYHLQPENLVKMVKRLLGR